jgi:hypothetical protein
MKNPMPSVETMTAIKLAKDKVHDAIVKMVGWKWNFTGYTDSDLTQELMKRLGELNIAAYELSYLTENSVQIDEERAKKKKEEEEEEAAFPYGMCW